MRGKGLGRAAAAASAVAAAKSMLKDAESRHAAAAAAAAAAPTRLEPSVAKTQGRKKKEKAGRKHKMEKQRGIKWVKKERKL